MGDRSRSGGRVEAVVLSTLMWATACAGDEGGGLIEAAPTQIAEIEVDGGEVRVAPLGDAIAVAWQDPMSGATTVARFDAGLQEVWRVTLGSGLPLRLRVTGGRIHVLVAEELFVLDDAGAIVGQWPVPGVLDFAVREQRLVVLRSDGVVELDDAGAELAKLPVDPGLMIPRAIEASAAGYCVTGIIADDNTTTCFGWDGAQGPVRLQQPDLVASNEREFVALSRDGVVSTLAPVISGLNLYSLRLADGAYVGEYAFEGAGEPTKVFLGPDDRAMWLALEEWCDDSCHLGFRVGLLNGSSTTATWRSDLFRVTGAIGARWTAVYDGDRVLVATDRSVFVVSNEPA